MRAFVCCNASLGIGSIYRRRPAAESWQEAKQHARDARPTIAPTLARRTPARRRASPGSYLMPGAFVDQRISCSDAASVPPDI
jgi:hypothetical protein